MKFIALLLSLVVGPAFAAKKITLTASNSVLLRGPINPTSVTKAQQELADLAADTTEDIYLVLNSPGGSITAGNALIDFAKSLPNKVHTVTIFAASMAYITAQSLDNRYIIPSGEYMSHRARIGGLSGQVPGEAGSRLKHIRRMVTIISAKIAKRVGITYKSYMKSIYDELWLTSYDAIRRNHADKIVTAACDASLSGTYDEYIRTIFGTFKLTYSKCPLIQGPVKVGTSSQKIENYIRHQVDFRGKKAGILVY